MVTTTKVIKGKDVEDACNKAINALMQIRDYHKTAFDEDVKVLYNTELRPALIGLARALMWWFNCKR